MLDEINEFTWPGFDLRAIKGDDRVDYGFFPPKLFAQLIEKFGELHDGANVARILRDK